MDRLTWRDYLTLIIAEQEKLDRQEAANKPEAVHVDSIEDFATALKAARGRIE